MSDNQAEKAKAQILCKHRVHLIVQYKWSRLRDRFWSVRA